METKNTPPSLHELQLWMRWIVTDPRGVKEALADPFPSNRINVKRYTSPPKTALPWIAETPPISKTARLDIYAEAYFARLLESMKSDFQITARILGDISFQKLVSDYIKEYPSQTTNIGEIGRSFSKFVSTYQALENAAFLESLIQMEWLLIESFYADDSSFIEPSNLTSLSDEDWESAEFRIAHSVQLLQSRWPLDQFWQLKDESIKLDSVAFEPLADAQEFLFVREGAEVLIEPMSAPEYVILQKLKTGASLIAALEEAQSEFSEDDIESQIMNWFNGWISRGIICDIKIKKQKVNL